MTGLRVAYEWLTTVPPRRIKLNRTRFAMYVIIRTPTPKDTDFRAKQENTKFTKSRKIGKMIRERLPSTPDAKFRDFAYVVVVLVEGSISRCTDKCSP